MPNDVQSTSCWLEQAAAGNSEAWKRLVQAYSRRVYGLLLNQCHDPDLAQELTQDTFVKVVKALAVDSKKTPDARYREQGRFEPWLFRVAMNGLRDEMRRRKRQARPTDFNGQNALVLSRKTAPDDRPGGVGEDPAQAALREEWLAWLKRAVAGLPEEDRNVLYLRHTAQLSFKEIAETLDQPLGTVLARGHRALAKLRKLAKAPQSV
ncbi:MAG: sigma-70 family RNA polymerase sigma factor [Algisphaera sp.]